MDTLIRCEACKHLVQPQRSYEPSDNGLYDEGGYWYWACPNCGEEMLKPDSAVLGNAFGIPVIVDPTLPDDEWYFWTPDWFDERERPRRNNDESEGK